MMTQKIIKECEKILEEIKAIGYMCIKCNCNKIILHVVSICDSCLKDKHTSKVVYTIKVDNEL